jgi:ferric-dicitrate binding protein FerR (iron transport regulator)
MAETNKEIMGLIARHAKGEKLTEDQMTIVRKWYSLSEDHRLMADLQIDMPWLDEDKQAPADVPTMAVWRLVNKHMREANPPKKDPSAYGWLIWPVLAILLAGSVFIIFQLIRKPAAPSNEYAGQPSTHNIGNPNLLRLADGRQIALDTVANGTSIALSGGASLVKITEDSMRVKGLPSGRPVIAQTLSVGVHHKPLNILFSDNTRIQLASASEYAWSGLRNGNVLKKGRARFAVTHDPSQPFAVQLPDKTLISDIGTSFEIDATNATEPRVHLADGSVRVDGVAGSLFMKPNQNVIIRNGSPATERPTTDTALSGWAHIPMVFAFKGASLDRVAQSFASYYGLTIYKSGIPGDVGRLTITINTRDGIKINQEKFENVLKNYARIRINKDSLIISGIK